jgi:hypothetical protein
MGVLLGGEAPQSKRWVFLSGRLIFRVGKINSFRIIGQSILFLLCLVNDVKFLIINNL